MIRNLLSRIKNLFMYGTTTRKGAGGFYDIKILANENINDVPYYQQYGFASDLPKETSVIILSNAGDKSDPVIMADGAIETELVDENGYSITLSGGVVYVYTSNDNIIKLIKESNEMHVTTVLFFIDGKLDVTGDITSKSGDVISKTGDIISTAGDVKDDSLTTPSMEDIRTLFNSHTHTETGSTTTIPIQQM